MQNARVAMIKCDWTPSISMIERKVNVHKFMEQRKSLYEKLVTFEGPMHLSRFGKLTLLRYSLA